MALILAVEEDCRALALTDDERTELARAAFLAMIEAWPGMRHDGPSGGGISQEPLQLSHIILPFTENPDDKA